MPYTQQQFLTLEDVDTPSFYRMSEIVTAIADIGALQRERTVIETEMNAEISDIRELYEMRSNPVTLKIRNLCTAVKAYCDEHRDVLLPPDAKTKTVKLPSGDVTWRKGRDKVVVTGDEEKIMFQLIDRELVALLRTETTLDKQAILKNPDAIKNIRGIKIEQAPETFSIKPNETKLAEVVG